MLGLTHSEIRLYEYDPAWKIEARRTIETWKKVLGDTALDIQHVGSTAIPTIRAKPIIDIAVLVTDFGAVLKKSDELRNLGFHQRPWEDDSQLFFACGSLYERKGDLQTHFIHVLPEGSDKWRDYLLFRDFLCKNSELARAYEAEKLRLAESFSPCKDRRAYLAGKQKIIAYILRKALVDFYLGKRVHIEIDRPIGAEHPKHPGVFYPINYGYIPGVLGGDGEELDVYLLGVDQPVREYTARVIAIVHRLDDEEDKLVAAPENLKFSSEEIRETIRFQERFHTGFIETAK